MSDNAAGIAEMSGEFHGEPQRIMVSLDAVGNTTKAVTKGFAIGSAVIAAVALFASFIETAGAELGTVAENLKDGVLRAPELAINVAEPKIFIGLLIGGSVPFLFSALAIRAVGRTAGVVVQEVRRQFADGMIMAGTKRPDYGPVIDICTAASLRELTTPALLAVLTPVVVGFGIGWQALGGFLAAVILVGQLMANYLSNAGGAWDNAKKYIEDGHHGGKGSDAHKAAVIGDTVGDPFKDTAGPALNPLIKVMNLVSLLMLPAIIASEDDAVPLRGRRSRRHRADRVDHLLVPQGRHDHRQPAGGCRGQSATLIRRSSGPSHGVGGAIVAFGPVWRRAPYPPRPCCPVWPSGSPTSSSGSVTSGWRCSCSSRTSSRRSPPRSSCRSPASWPATPSRCRN